MKNEEKNFKIALTTTVIAYVIIIALLITTMGCASHQGLKQVKKDQKELRFKGYKKI